MAVTEDPAHTALRERLGKGARYDAASAPARKLSWARRGTAYFARKLNELSDADLDEPSALPGFSRRQIVASVGYQARNLALAIETLRTGVPNPPLSAEERDEQTALGATLPARALRHLFAHAEAHLNVEWRDLTDAHWGGSVDYEADRPFPVVQTPWLRSRSVWLHAVDLGNGGSFRDFPPDFLDAIIDSASASLGAGVSVNPSDRPRRETNGSGLVVAGATPDLARWISGRGARRLESTGDLPAMPLWT